MRKHINVSLGIGTLLLLLLVSACGYSPATTTTMTDHPTNQVTATTAMRSNQSLPSTVIPSPKQILKKSSQIMHHVREVHFTVDAKRQDVTTSATSTGSATSLLQALQPQAGRGANNMWKQGQGDEDSTSGKSQITLNEKIDPPTFDAHSGSLFSLDQRMQGNTVYLFGGLPTQRSWYVINKQTLLSQTGTQLYTGTHLYAVSGMDQISALSGMDQIRALIDLAVQDGTLSDKGSETLGGSALRHIQVTLSKQGRAALRNLDVENYDATFASTQTANTQGTIDFWIDEQTGYVSRLASTLVFQTTDNRMTPTTIQQTLVFNCSRFNQPVSISLPQQVIPATSIDQIYPYVPS